MNSLVGGVETMSDMKLGIFLSVAAAALVLIFTSSPSHGYTDDRDVYAINSLYSSLGSPPIPGWIPNGGDPCLEAWQGVQCVGSNITAIILNAANLGGQLGDNLGNFTSLITLDLTNNNIGGNIPDNLPIAMRKFFLSANQFTGSIPRSLSELTLLSDMSLNENHLFGELPDAFQSLTGLINLDLSSNNLSNQLPPSIGNLSSLTSLHLQNNKLSGILNVLQDLPLKDLNIENNLFSGPVPEKLFKIPNFKSNGNPFNTSIAPSPAPLPPSLPPLTGAPVPLAMHSNISDGLAAHKSGPPARKISTSTIRIIAYAVVAVIVVIVAVLLVIFCISKCQERKLKHQKLSKMQEGGVHGRRAETRKTEHFLMSNNVGGAMPVEPAMLRNEEHIIDITGTDPTEASGKKVHAFDVGQTGVLVMPPPAERVIINPVSHPAAVRRNAQRGNVNPGSSVISFSVASLQQYTNSFSEENLIREARLGRVYLAELPDGKLLTIMKLDIISSKLPVDEFMEVVLGISELKHPNIFNLVGYCAEYEQRLLVYDYFSKRTLHDVLHCGDDLKRELSWKARLQVSLEAAKALQYLHDGCQPPVVHQNFEPNNILLNDDLAVCVTECGLASLMSSISVTQLSGRMRSLLSYEAPELNECRTYSDRSDVYSFGVVMLELLTGRTPYDSSRPRAEQHLVRWASSQLHDINALSRMVDPSIGGKYPEKSLSWFTDIVSRCIQQGPEFRPSISEIVQDLTRIVEDMGRKPVEAPTEYLQAFRTESVEHGS